MRSTDDANQMLAMANKARDVGRSAIAEARTLINAILTDEQLNNMSPEDARSVLKMTVRSLNTADNQIAQIGTHHTAPGSKTK